MRFAILFCLLFAPAISFAQPTNNLLRNGDFQDDWLTLLPQMKNHHWCYPYDFYNRRDYNPDGWTLKGTWHWDNADGPRGTRLLKVDGPAEIKQHVNWVLLHDDRALEGFPDAGGFPVMKAARSKRPERLVRDLKLRVRFRGEKVPLKAGVIELGISLPGGTSGDPMGTWTAPLLTASVNIPGGDYETQWAEVLLPAKSILEALQKQAKDPKEAPLAAKEGILLPALIQVAIRYTAKEGSVQVHEAVLTAAENDHPSLLANGGFEDLDKEGYPRGWSGPLKYRYFPPRHYYIFNTWHNTNFANRGSVAADPLLRPTTLRMVVPSGDEVMVLSDPIVLNQAEPRLIEVSAVVATDQLCMLQIDAVTEDGQRLDGFNWIHKAPVSIGTNRWRTIRQVFRPRVPVKSFRLALCARGANGCTLDDTGSQPQNNVVGMIWWDDVKVTEPESSEAELKGRGLKGIKESAPAYLSRPHIEEVDFGERRFGKNELKAVVVNPGEAGIFSLNFLFPPLPDGNYFTSKDSRIGKGERGALSLHYFIRDERCDAYDFIPAHLSLGREKKGIGASAIAFSTWNTPIDLHLGGLYLEPGAKQFVRMNLGISQHDLKETDRIRLEVIGRAKGEVIKTVEIKITPEWLRTQRTKAPADLRGDLCSLVLADLDVSFLPIQPFADPQRNWFVRATVVYAKGKAWWKADSPPFCRLAHDAPQPPIGKVTIENDLLFVNGQPWMPWGVTYGHNPVYAGPADPGPGKYRDLANLPEWSLYDRHGPFSSSRAGFDFNCLRYVAGSISAPKGIEEKWAKDNLYCSTAFATPGPAFSLEDAFKQAGGKEKLDAYLSWCKTNPAVVAVTPGIEEAFGLFLNATPGQLKTMEQVVDYLRKGSGKPVMVGHGGYWNRLEFERVPFFDIFDPETEPLYPANLHTDLAPYTKGKNKVVWLRPQMYESVPYERWRFHVYVELMRGGRGWQIAHGHGDASLFRGLHGEMEFWKPIVYSKDAGPQVKVEPWIEHWSRRHAGKTFIIAAGTHGIALGKWQWSDDAPPGTLRSRVTEKPHELSDESNAYAIGEKPTVGPASHGIQYLPDARVFPAGSKLIQWVKLDGKAPPGGFTVLVKGDGRWTHGAGWGKVDLKPLQDPKTAYWFLNSFYRHAKGFLGWGTDLVPKAMEFVPSRVLDRGALPATGTWVQLEVPLKDLGAEGKLVDGVGFMHSEGRVLWGKTAIVTPDGKEQLVFGDEVGLPTEARQTVRIHVAGLKKGMKVRVLFEDRDIVAQDGFFEDDFRGQDLYQRHGGGYGAGYGDAPVALHLYEIKGL